jgi:hypothetical protein
MYEGWATSGPCTVTIADLLPADLLAYFPYKLNTFRKRVKKVVTNK